MTTSPELQETLNKYWSGRAEAYHHNQLHSERAEFERPLWQAVWAQALENRANPANRANPENPDTPTALKVLDLGCGSGYVTHLLADAGFNTTGIDGAAEMIAQAEAENQHRQQNSQATATFLHGDAHQPQFAPHSFDAITSRYVLWTLLDPEAALKNWMELLKPGGVIACVDAAWYPEGIDPATEVVSTDGPDAFLQTYTPEFLSHLPLSTIPTPDHFAQLFRTVGLENVTVTPIEGLAELDQRFGLSPGHESTPQYLFRGTVPTN